MHSGPHRTFSRPFAVHLPVHSPVLLLSVRYVHAEIQWQYFRHLETNASVGASFLVRPRSHSGEVLMRQFWIHASFTLLIATAVTFAPAAQGQSRGGVANGGAVARGSAAAPAHTTAVPATHSAAAAPHVSSAAPRAGAPAHAPVRTSVAGVGRIPVGGVPIRGGSQGRRTNMMSGLSTLPSFATSFGNTPGLGFDFPHMAAVDSDRGFRRGHSHLNEGSFGFGGFLLSSPEVIVMEGQQGEGGQAAPDEEAIANAGNNGGNSDRNLEDQFLPAANRLGPPAPVRDASEYVFVRRDGTLLFGVAYSWDKGTLRYITREGQRRSISQDALDMDATQQFNEQRGVNFHTPA